MMTDLQLPVAAEDDFCTRFAEHQLVASRKITTLQINLGLQCNLACKHCHVESSPKRTAAQENMSRATAERVVGWLTKHAAEIETMDLTGGSPEMNPNFRWLVGEARRLGVQVIDRCNPTIIGYREPAGGESYSWIPEFLAAHQVHVVASLPCYLEDNVRAQRGLGAYDASIEGLRRLNAVGYGRLPHLHLNLVYNPTGPQLPPPQPQLEADYRRELKARFDLDFNQLWTIANMPIKRWRHDLERSNKLDDYMRLLIESFNPETIPGLMCRHQIHVDSQGRLYDCDFNYAVELPIDGPQEFLWDVTLDELKARQIATGNHCYGCTAGVGSSCGGAIT